MQIELFDARVLAPLVQFLDHGGARSETYLERAAIPQELIEGGGWISKKQAYDFTYDVVQGTQCPDAVYSAYLGFELAHLGPIADAIRMCRTVKEALELAARLGNIAYQGSEYFLRVDGETTWFCYREPQVVSIGQPFVIDMTLAVYYHLIRITADDSWRPERMLTQGGIIDRHHSVMNFEECRANGHPEISALGFPTRYLSRRLPWEPQDSEFDERQAWLFGPDGHAPIVDVLYRLVASRFPHRKLPTLEQVANMVGSSPATLKRQLQAAGMSYGRLLDRLRFDTACEMLAIKQMPIRDIAYELGYSGTNNFVRSFRRMTGLTPGGYRQRQAEEDA